METLYDLLGALPRDDAEGLRSAFRRAVKGTHPDLNPGDPDAGLKFRQIVRANEILGDADQRAAYDHLLDLAHQEQRQLSKRAAANTIHQIASGVIAFAVVTSAIAGGYLLDTQMPEEWTAPIGQVAAAVRVSTETAVAAVRRSSEAVAAVARQSSEAVATVMRQSSEAAATVERQSTETVTATVMPARPDAAPAAPVETKVQVKQSETLESMQLPPEPIEPTAVTLRPNLGDPPAARIGPPLDLTATVVSARSYREHGIIAYRNGDLNGAIANFDQAIQLDPKFTAAYIDRGIVFYRMQKFDRAFADLARAKRIEKTNRAKSPMAQGEAKKPRPPQPIVAAAAASVPHKRTARLASSRQEGFPFTPGP